MDTTRPVLDGKRPARLGNLSHQLRGQALLRAARPEHEDLRSAPLVLYGLGGEDCGGGTEGGGG